MRLFVLNPVAGHGKARSLLMKIREVFPNDTVAETQYSGHATEITSDAARSGKYDVVIAVGGDGTVSEVAAGLRGTRLSLGILPAGTGNDTCRGYRIPVDFDKASEIIRQGKSKAVDIMSVDGQIHLNISSIGFDAQVVKNTEHLKRFGSVSYAMAVFLTLMKYRSTKVRMTIDGKINEGSFYLAAVGCGTHYGGGMNVLPMADPCDGYMDLCLIDPVSFFTVIRVLPAFMKGKHGKLSCVHFQRVKHILFEALDPKGYDLNMDGEVMQGVQRTDISILPSAQQVLMP